MVWIVTHLGDGYSDGWTNRYDQTDLINRLTLLQASGVKYLRIWLSFEDYFNADKLSAGFTAFNATFLSNLDNFINVVMPAVGMQAFVTVSNAYGSFLATWTVASSPFRASYLTAYQTIISRYIGNSNIWAWDMANEPLPAQAGANETDLLSFFTSVYTSGKATNPSHYFTVGSVGPTESIPYAAACDFFEVHYYSLAGEVPYHASDFSKPVILGETGQSGLNAAGTNVVREVFIDALTRGYSLIMPYDANYYATQATAAGANTYIAPNATLAMIQRITQPAAGIVNI